MRKIRVGVLVAKRGAVTMTTVVQEVARVTRLGKDTPERHLSEKFNPEIKISYLQTHLNCMCVCVQSVVTAFGSSWSVLSRLLVNSNKNAG